MADDFIFAQLMYQGVKVFPNPVILFTDNMEFWELFYLREGKGVEERCFL